MELAAIGLDYVGLPIAVSFAEKGNEVIGIDVNFDVAVNPEFLQEGYALFDSLHPKRIVIGVKSDYAKDKLLELYSSFQVPMFITEPISVMLIKYASNSFLATKISFINEMAQVCERIRGNIDDVAKGMGLDSRIGIKYLGAGIGYGGSCFLRIQEVFY